MFVCGGKKQEKQYSSGQQGAYHYRAISFYGTELEENTQPLIIIMQFMYVMFISVLMLLHAPEGGEWIIF